MVLAAKMDSGKIPTIIITAKNIASTFADRFFSIRSLSLHKKFLETNLYKRDPPLGTTSNSGHGGGELLQRHSVVHLGGQQPFFDLCQPRFIR